MLGSCNTKGAPASNRKPNSAPTSPNCQDSIVSYIIFLPGVAVIYIQSMTGDRILAILVSHTICQTEVNSALQFPKDEDQQDRLPTETANLDAMHRIQGAVADEVDLD